MSTKPTNESAEDYLERILMLKEEYGMENIHAIDLANSMGYSKASISIALKKLESEGYVTLGDKFTLHLTDAGLAIAQKIYERHLIISKMFVYLGVPEEIACKDACKIEHDLSDETFNAIKNRFENEIVDIKIAHTH